MTDTAPKVIVIPAKVETPQDQEKKRHLRRGSRGALSRPAPPEMADLNGFPGPRELRAAARFPKIRCSAGGGGKR